MAEVNVHEAKTHLSRLLRRVAAGEEIDLSDLEAHAPAVLADSSPLADAKQRLISLKELETEYIAWVVSRCEGNKTRAAELLGIDVSTIHRRGRERSGT